MNVCEKRKRKQKVTDHKQNQTYTYIWKKNREKEWYRRQRSSSNNRTWNDEAQNTMWMKSRPWMYLKRMRCRGGTRHGSEHPHDRCQLLLFFMGWIDEKKWCKNIKLKAKHPLRKKWQFTFLSLRSCIHTTYNLLRFLHTYVAQTTKTWKEKIWGKKRKTAEWW
jgi:hypothetical protein